jgi:hypothetical protein
VYHCGSWIHIQEESPDVQLLVLYTSFVAIFDRDGFNQLRFDASGRNEYHSLNWKIWVDILCQISIDIIYWLYNRLKFPINVKRKWMRIELTWVQTVHNRHSLECKIHRVLLYSKTRENHHFIHRLEREL